MELQNYIYELKPAKSFPLPMWMFYMVMLIELVIASVFLYSAYTENDPAFYIVSAVLFLSSLALPISKKLFKRIKVVLCTDNKLKIINPVGSYSFDMNLLKKIERQNSPVPVFYFLDAQNKRLGILGGLLFTPKQILELVEFLKTKIKGFESDLKKDLFPKDYTA